MRLITWLLSWVYARQTVASVVLGVHRLSIRRIAIRQLRELLPAYHRIFTEISQGGAISDAAISDMILVISVATRRSIDDVEAIPATPVQVIGAIHSIARAAGLQAQEGTDLGELARATSSMLTNLSPSFAAALDGTSATPKV